MTELHTIEVRYEDTDGRHVDVHEAAREGRHPDGSYRLEAGVCGCCDVEKETHAYSEENVVKVSYGPSEHERAEIDVRGAQRFLLLICVVGILLVVSVIWIIQGGTVSL